MAQVQIQAVIAAALFSVWPLIYQRAGVHWGSGLVIMTLITLLATMPIALYNGTPVIGRQLWIVTIAGVLLTGGLIVFNDMLQKSTPKEVGSLFVLMIVVETVIPAAYYVMMNGQPSLKKIVGFALAIVAAFCLA